MNQQKHGFGLKKKHRQQTTRKTKMNQKINRL